MLPPAQFLSLDLTKTSIQAPDNKSFLSDFTQLEASFADILQAPLTAGEAELVLPGGEPLPESGNDLPAATEEAPPGDAETPPFAPLIALPSMPAEPEPATSLARTANPEPVVQDGPNPLVSIAVNAADPDTASPRLVTDTGNDEVRIGAMEKASAHRPDRSGSLPVVRPATPLERVQPAPPATPAGVTEAGDDLALNLGRDAPQRPAVVATEEATSRIPLQPANDKPASPQPGAPVAPTLRLQSEGLDGAQRLPGPAAPGPAQAAFVDVPQAAASTAATARAAIPVVTTTIDQPVMDESWGDALRDRVVWMTGRRIQSAEIRLNPAELGPIRVQVSVEDDAAKLTFSAQHSLTREAIEQAMPRLREMLSENGLSLAGSTVTERDAADVYQDRQAQEQESAAAADSGAADDAEVELAPLRRVSSSALVDTFV